MARTVGSKNGFRDGVKITEIRTAIRMLFEAYGYNPLEELIKIANGENDISLEQKIAIHKELLQYFAPKQKAIDIQANVQGDININVLKFSDDNKTISVASSRAQFELPQPTEQNNNPEADALMQRLMKTAALDNEEEDDKNE